MTETHRVEPALSESANAVLDTTNIAALFRSGMEFSADAVRTSASCVSVDHVDAGWDGLVGLSLGRLPLLVLPEPQAALHASEATRVVVAAEGKDHDIANAIAAVLAPNVAMLEVVHVTWLSGIATPPIGAAGLDDPGHQDLLMYDGARAALIDRVDELRSAGFRVTTHLRFNRHPAQAINDYLHARPAAMFVLGLGKHGAGIGREVLREHGLPLLFVRTRE